VITHLVYILSTVFKPVKVLFKIPSQNFAFSFVDFIER
jgi:hypothetical protein